MVLDCKTGEGISPSPRELPVIRFPWWQIGLVLLFHVASEWKPLCLLHFAFDDRIYHYFEWINDGKDSLRMQPLLLRLFALGLFAAACFGQNVSGNVKMVNVDPTGSCGFPQPLQFNMANQALWGCGTDAAWHGPSNTSGGGVGSAAQIVYKFSGTNDVLCAHGADASIAGVVCNNSVDLVPASGINTFANDYQFPANVFQTGTRYRVTYEFVSWTSATTAQNWIFQTYYGNTLNNTATTGVLVWSESGTATISAGLAHAGWQMVCDVVSLSTTTMQISCINPAISNATLTANFNSVYNVTVATGTSKYLPIGFRWTSTNGVASGTYTIGGSITGTIGQTCTLTALNGTGGSGATATVALTGTNTIAGGTALVITNTGISYTGASTTATLGSGTATCSGTATIVTVLGATQGNALMKVGEIVELINP